MSGGTEYVITTLNAIVRVEGESPRVVHRGEPLPANALPGEAERLAKLGALGRRKAEPVAPADTVDPTDGGGGSAVEAHPFDIMGSSVEELAVHLATGKDGKPFNVTEVADMAKADDAAVAAERARKLLAAETARGANMGADPREGVVSALAKLIEADPAGA